MKNPSLCAVRGVTQLRPTETGDSSLENPHLSFREPQVGASETLMAIRDTNPGVRLVKGNSAADLGHLGLRQRRL